MSERGGRRTDSDFMFSTSLRCVPNKAHSRRAFLLRMAGATLAAVPLTSRRAHAAGVLPEESTWRVWLEPRFTRAAASKPIAGARQTDIVGGFTTDDGPTVFSHIQWAALGLDWDTFFARARIKSGPELAALKPRFVRDRRTKVIEYAVLASDQPIVASAVLAPQFLTRFGDTLGPTVLVALPNRYTAYLFPKLASNYQQLASPVIEAFHATVFPVSLEVFEFMPGGIRAAGAYEEP